MEYRTIRILSLSIAVLIVLSILLLRKLKVESNEEVHEPSVLVKKSRYIEKEVDPHTSLKKKYASKYLWRQEAWVEAFKSGKYSSNTEIAVKVFGKSPPRKSMEEVHTYPIYNVDTLASWLDWDCDVQPIKYKTVTCYLHLFMGNKTLGWHEDCPATADDLLPEAERSGVKEVDIKAGDTIFLQTDNLWW